jgi:hypothetical protein
MNFNEAQQAVLRDYDDGKHAHLVEADPRSDAVSEIQDPLLHFMLENTSRPLKPANKPCEIVASIAASASIQLEIISRKHASMRYDPRPSMQACPDRTQPSYPTA